MRKKIALAITIIVLCLLATAGFSQKKDSTVSFDTVYVFSKNEVWAIRTIMMGSALKHENGEQFTGNELMQLLNWMDSRRTLIPKQQPKK